MHGPRRAGAVRFADASLAALVLAVSTWQAQLTRHSPGARWSVAALVVVAIGAALVLGRGRQCHTARQWASQSFHFVRAWPTQSRSTVVSALVWAVLVGAIVAWDLVSFVVESHDLPTLSYFIGHVTRYPVGRGFFFAAWLGVGGYLVSARRCERPR